MLRIAKKGFTTGLNQPWLRSGFAVVLGLEHGRAFSKEFKLGGGSGGNGERGDPQCKTTHRCRGESRPVDPGSGIKRI